MAKMGQDAQLSREQMAVNAQIAREKNMTDAEIELLKGAGMM